MSLFYVYIAFSLVQSVTSGQIRGRITFSCECIYLASWFVLLGIYGVQFPTNNGAFSAVTLFQTFGFISGFASSVKLCTYQKAFIYLGITFLSFITYGGLSVKNSYYEQKELKLKENSGNDKQLEIDEKESLFAGEKW